MDIYRDASAAQRDVSNMLHTQFSLGIGGSIDLQVLVSDESWEADSKLRYMVLQKNERFLQHTESHPYNQLQKV